MSASKPQTIAGWVLTGLVVLFLVGGSASGKFLEFDGKAEMMDHLGYSIPLIQKIGVLEVVVALLLLVPRASFFATILLTGYLGGAVATHVRVGDPFWFPIIIGALAWVALGLRRPEVFRLAAGSRPDGCETGGHPVS